MDFGIFFPLLSIYSIVSYKHYTENPGLLQPIHSNKQWSSNRELMAPLGDSMEQSVTPHPRGLGWWTVAKCHLHCHRDMVEMCQNLIKQTITRGGGSQLSYKPHYSISLIKSRGVLLILIKPLCAGQNLTNNELYRTRGEGTWRTKGKWASFLESRDLWMNHSFL